MKKLRDATLIISPDYLGFIEDLKARVVSARVTAARAINHEAIPFRRTPQKCVASPQAVW